MVQIAAAIYAIFYTSEIAPLISNQNIRIFVNIVPLFLLFFLQQYSTHYLTNRLQEDLKCFVRNSSIANVIASLNHEINNPLSIAISGLYLLDKRKQFDQNSIDKTKQALQRIDELIKNATRMHQFEEVDYTKYTKMIKLVKDKD